MQDTLRQIAGQMTVAKDCTKTLQKEVVVGSRKVLEDVKVLAEQKFAKVTVDNSKKVCEHVAKVEDKYFESERRIDVITEELGIGLNYYSDDESASDYEKIRKIQEDASGGESEFAKNFESDDEQYVPPQNNDSSDSDASEQLESFIVQDSPIYVNTASTTQQHESANFIVNPSASKPSHKRKRGQQGKTISIGDTEQSKDGTTWKVIDSGSVPGRRAQHNIYREESGPTSYAKRNVRNNCVVSAWHLIINDSMLRHIKECTIAEAHRCLKNDTWTITLEELEAALAIMYARGVYGAKNFPTNSLWSTLWGPQFFSQ
ncbi:uncharacterized protein [Diabrotica undecimpunctata]|uniref:uncharacterized protein n=1 Tax=Diabrotica undecimpunctata TaxID=50387 RepID=UPI003B63EA6C